MAGTVRLVWSESDGTWSIAGEDHPLPVTATLTGAPLVVGGGVEATAQRVTIASDSTGVLSVDDNGASLTVDGTVSATSAGDIAHDSADSGNPVKQGFKALSAQPTAVTANDRVNAQSNLLGSQIVQPYAHEASFVSGVTAAITDTTTTQVIAAPAAGLKLYITTLIVQNDDATVGTWVAIEEETSGTDLAQIYAAAAGGGAVVTFPTPLVVPTAAKGLFAKCETTSAQVRVTAVGYKAP